MISQALAFNIRRSRFKVDKFVKSKANYSIFSELNIKFLKSLTKRTQIQQQNIATEERFKKIDNKLLILKQQQRYNFQQKSFLENLQTHIIRIKKTCFDIIKEEVQFQHFQDILFYFKLLQVMTYFEEAPVLDNLNLAQISSLMNTIEVTTSLMSQTFEQSILKHQQQFIKAYKIKIYQLTGLFHQLKKNIEDKFINNAITQQLQTMIKERDYFKYECLKLNTQYKNVLDDYKNLTQQVVNVTEQMNIYKHLLENQKIRSTEIEKNVKKLKNNLNELSSKPIQQIQLMHQSKSPQRSFQEEKDRIMKLKRQIKQKTQTIRALKAKIDSIESFQESRFLQKEERKQLQQVFRGCVQSWKREVLSKSRKFSSPKYSSSGNRLGGFSSKSKLSLNSCTIDQFNGLQKKQLLQMLFTNPLFLEFIQKLLFDGNFQVNFIDHSEESDNKKQQILVRNRNKLYELMKKKGLIGTIANHPMKYR